MTTTNLSVHAQNAPDPQSQEKQREAERLHDILLMLQNLCTREAVTVKVILGCLYDIASVNLINKKIPSPLIQKFLKLATRTSKPVFVFIGLRWFQRNCPKLIADWLYSLVQFQPEEIEATQIYELQQELIELSPEASTPEQLTPSQVTEVRRLQNQVQILAASLVVLTGALSFRILG